MFFLYKIKNSNHQLNLILCEKDIVFFNYQFLS